MKVSYTIRREAKILNNLMQAINHLLNSQHSFNLRIMEKKINKVYFKEKDPFHLK